MKKKIRIMIVDDHQLFRQGVAMVVEALDNVEIVGEASDGIDFLEKLNRLDVDLVFMDIKMPKMNGVEAAKIAKERQPNIKVVALSMFGEERYLQKMLEVGVDGFLLKNTSIDEITNAIELVMNGKACYSDELLEYFTNKYIKKDNADSLTARELEVLEYVSKGLSNQEIADKLFISKRTIDGHKSSLILKTGSNNVVDLLIYAVKKGLVTIE